MPNALGEPILSSGVGRNGFPGTKRSANAGAFFIIFFFYRSSVCGNISEISLFETCSKEKLPF